MFVNSPAELTDETELSYPNWNSAEVLECLLLSPHMTVLHLTHVDFHAWPSDEGPGRVRAGEPGVS